MQLNRRKEQQRRMLYVAQMNLIQKAWDSDNISRVRDLLNASRPRPGTKGVRVPGERALASMAEQNEKGVKVSEEALKRLAPWLEKTAVVLPEEMK